MKKIIPLLLACLMIISVFAGCGHNEEIQDSEIPPYADQIPMVQTEATESEISNNFDVLKDYLNNVLIPQYGVATVGNIDVSAEVKSYGFNCDWCKENWYKDNGLLSAYFVDENRMVIARLADGSDNAMSKLIIELYKNNGSSVEKSGETEVRNILVSGGTFELYALNYNDRQYLCVEMNITGIIASGIHKEILISEITDCSFEEKEKIDCAGSSEFVVYSTAGEIGSLTDSDISQKIDSKINEYGLNFSFEGKDSYGFSNFNIAVNDKTDSKLTKICDIGVPVDETTEKPKNGKLNFTIKINDYTEIERDDSHKKSSSLDYGQTTIEDYGDVDNDNSYSNGNSNSSPSISALSSKIAGIWTRSDGDLSFSGGTSGTYKFDSVGMYDETGSYSISSDGTLTMTSRQQGTRSMNYASADVIKNGGKGWCIDGNTLYLGASYNDYLRK